MPDSPTPTEFANQLLDPSLAPRAFAQDDAARARVTSTWRGSGEALGRLGLRPGAEVRERDLAAVVSGRHVRTGVRLFPAGTSFDLVFTAPNSLSFLWTQLSSPRRAEVEDAIVASVALAFDRLTGENPVVGGVRPARSYAAALVLHAIGTTSGANGPIPPMLHVHSCLFAVLDDDGTFTVPHEATLYDEDLLYLTDAMTETDLADRLVHLGYPVHNTAGTGDHSFEISGVPPELLAEDFWRNTGCAVADFG